ncbi:polyprenol phosphomannose-dependent alpha 1,6 mannosyltransferase MptB [Galactobacter caseinivorans]|uniref:DUF2029 domain-containing protein n=1 Tax=Galactobacter caseinivorans TaxID=2676123 RepID=A0A496PGY7_9MICC|nr:polyprenol phosphomannose-dependent alpha 1,6 mannosyltransferase MptB [Galactobacter caseinivorans]RKW69743.1 hypothetical protein DWQ67_11655 [Galactobacter caseinivorans]
MSDAAPATQAVGSALRPHLGTLLFGFVGSILVLCGSFGVGWLAPSSPVNRWKWLIPWRTELPGLITVTVLLTLGCWMLVAAWLRLGRELKPWTGSIKPTVTAMVLWTLPMMIALPIFSRDVFAYIGQGRIVLAGGNPYEQSISSINNWLQLGADAYWADSQTAYGPLFYWMAAAIVHFTGTNTEAGVFAFRLLAWAGMALVLVFLPKLAALHGVNPQRAVWITAASPLFLLSFIASAHNDALMVGLAVAATYFAARRWGVLAVFLLVLSIGIKPITIVMLPFLGLLWAGQGSSWPRRIRYWVYSAALALGMLAIMGLPGGFGFGWVKATLTSGGGYMVNYAPLGLLVLFFAGVLTVLQLDSAWVLPAVQMLGRLVAVVVIVYLLFRGSYSRLVQRMLIGFTALVVLSPVIHPWYLLWLLPFFAATGIRDDWQSLWVVVTVGFFVALGCSDQLFVWQFVADYKAILQVISVCVSIGCAALLVLAAKPTKASIQALLPRKRPFARRREAKR